MGIQRISNRYCWTALLLSSVIASSNCWAAERVVSVGVDGDTMIAFDANTNALPPPIGSNGTGAFGTGVEAANPLNGLPLTIRGGNPFDESSITAKPLIRFNLGATAGLNIEPGLPYFLELTTQTDANSNDTFRIYSITDSATRSFNEATLTWNNAPAVATASKIDFEAAGNEVGVFFRPSSIDIAGTSIGHPLMGSQLANFTTGANSFVTFGLTSTETNRWVVTDRTSTKPPRLITYDIVESASGGILTAAGTWAGTANQVDTLYRVRNGNTVTVNGASPFAGKGVVVGTGAAGPAVAGDYDGNGTVGPSDYTKWRTDFGTSVASGSGADGNNNGVVDGADYTVWRDRLGQGGAALSTLHFTANEVNLPLIVVNGDGQITNGTGTSLSIGSPLLSRDQVHAGGAVGSTVRGATGGLIINKDLTYSAQAGQEDLSINIPLISYHNFTFNGVNNSDLRLRFPAGHRGTINFNGSGDEVVVSENEGIGGTLVMNSSGANRLAFEGFDSEQEFDKGTVVFNQAGAISHRSEQDDFQGIGNLVANAPVTIDLSTTYPAAGPQANERRFQITRDLRGSSAITVVGPNVAPTGTGNTENQFEIGVDTRKFTDVSEAAYSGVMSTQGFVQVDARASMPNAKIVVNANGLLATGFEPHAAYPHQLAPTSYFGEIEVAAETSAGAANGGLLEVGFLTATTGQGDHAPQNLRLTKSGGRNGNLTLRNGSSLVMQINGEPTYTPPAVGDPGNCTDPLQATCLYAGPVIDTIEVEGLATLDGELLIRLNADVSFQAEAGQATPADPDYFPLVVGDTWDLIRGVSGGSITGTFDSITVIDTLNDLTPTQTFQVLYSSPTLVQVRLIDTAATSAAAVPEPDALGIMFLFGIFLRSYRWRFVHRASSLGC
jgi:hypothetical protein